MVTFICNFHAYLKMHILYSCSFTINQHVSIKCFFNSPSCVCINRKFYLCIFCLHHIYRVGHIADSVAIKHYIVNCKNRKNVGERNKSLWLKHIKEFYWEMKHYIHETKSFYFFFYLLFYLDSLESLIWLQHLIPILS